MGFCYFLWFFFLWVADPRLEFFVCDVKDRLELVFVFFFDFRILAFNLFDFSFDFDDLSIQFFINNFCGLNSILSEKQVLRSNSILELLDEAGKNRMLDEHGRARCSFSQFRLQALSNQLFHYREDHFCWAPHIVSDVHHCFKGTGCCERVS